MDITPIYSDHDEMDAAAQGSNTVMAIAKATGTQTQQVRVFSDGTPFLRLSLRAADLGNVHADVRDQSHDGVGDNQEKAFFPHDLAVEGEEDKGRGQGADKVLRFSYSFNNTPRTTTTETERRGKSLQVLNLQIQLLLREIQLVNLVGEQILRQEVVKSF